MVFAPSPAPAADDRDRYRRPEYRFQEFLDGGNGVIAWGRVARTVERKMPSGFIFSTSSAEVCAGRWSGDSLYPPASAGCCAWHQIISHDVERQLVFFFRFWQAPVSVQLPCVQLYVSAVVTSLPDPCRSDLGTRGLFLTPAPLRVIARDNAAILCAFLAQ